MELKLNNLLNYNPWLTSFHLGTWLLFKQCCQSLSRQDAHKHASLIGSKTDKHE